MYVSLLPHFRHAHLHDSLLSQLHRITNEPCCTNALLNCHLLARVNTDILGQGVLQRGKGGHQHPIDSGIKAASVIWDIRYYFVR